MAFWYYPRVLFRARGVDFEVGLHPLNGRWQQPCCSKANLWLKFTIQETFSSSSMAFDGSLRPKESWRWHQNRILSHLFQLYVKICWDDYTRNVCYPFMTYRKSTRDQKNNFAAYNKPDPNMNCENQVNFLLVSTSPLSCLQVPWEPR